MKQSTITRFLLRTFMIYGILTLMLNIFTLIFGEDAQGYSTLFSLAGQGIGTATSLQFLAAIAMINILSLVLMSDRIIISMSRTLRMAVLFSSVFIVMIAFIAIFDWFPLNDIKAWVMFIVCSCVCIAISTIVSSQTKKQEDRSLEEALRRAKEENT